METLGYFVIHSVTCLLAISTRDLDLHFTRYQHFASTEKKKRMRNRRKSKEIVLDFDIQRQIDPRRRTFGDLTQGTKPRRIPSTDEIVAPVLRLPRHRHHAGLAV